MDAATIEQANKLRKSLGLPLLPVAGAPPRSPDGPSFKEDASSDDSDEEPASTLETREAAGYANFKQVQDAADAKKHREEKAAAIKKARDAAQKFTKLQGKGLGDIADEGDLDAKAWLKGQNKRQKKIERERARRTEEELAERERLAGIEYGSADLAGVKVGHSVADFEDAEGEQILTLKDTTIDENEEEGDELENADIVSRDRLNERLELKKRKPVYDPNAVDENGEHKILSHYDEEIDGKKRKRFTLDGQGATTEEREAKRQEIGQLLRAQPISLDILKELPTSDYLDISEIKIKKPKRSKKATRRKVADEDDIFPVEAQSHREPMDIDSREPKWQTVDDAFVDDDDLQASLAAQRRAAFKNRKRRRPEDIARELQEEAASTPGDAEEDTEGPGLIIDDTSEFVANLQRPTVLEKQTKGKAREAAPAEDTAASPNDENSDVDMDHGLNAEEEAELLAGLQSQLSAAGPALTTTGLDEEATLDQGLGSTLNLLKQRGLVETVGAGDKNTLLRHRLDFLAEKRRRGAEAERRARLQREQDRSSQTFGRMSKSEREDNARYMNQQRDAAESRKEAEIFNREYKPDVSIKYIDEFGRSMSAKEAFKHLSHQFHGKGSGKQKTEKRLKKIEDEHKREAMSALDSSQATVVNNAMGSTAKKNKQAGVRLA